MELNESRLRVRVAMFVVAVWCILHSLSMAQSAKTEEPMLAVTLAADRAQYSLADDIGLDVRVANVRGSPVTVFGQLLWGYAGGLVLHVTDRSGRDIPAKALDDDMVIPSMLEDRIWFVVLSRYHYLGTTRLEPLKDLVEEPGTYFIQVEYLSPVGSDFGQGPEFWSRERGSVWSNKIEVHVTRE